MDRMVVCLGRYSRQEAFKITRLQKANKHFASGFGVSMPLVTPGTPWLTALLAQQQ